MGKSLTEVKEDEVSPIKWKWLNTIAKSWLIIKQREEPFTLDYVV